MTIETIRQLVRNKQYQVKLHAVQHALKEEFGEQKMIDAILSGRVIEDYQDRQRVLVCGQTTLESNIVIYLHVVCEQYYDDQVELVTAYIPDEREWEKPPFRRRLQRK
ncbi:MAG: DUF4258 domain-containing protein [Chloroflexi bacterium]|nr:DUF4258 domain-containing protein [Chloroflexota bacterium]